jgi:uncharacterized protein YggE
MQCVDGRSRSGVTIRVAQLLDRKRRWNITHAVCFARVSSGCCRSRCNVQLGPGVLSGMRRLLTILVAAGALAPGGVSAQSATDAAGPPALVVQGQGAITRAPDTASVSVGIETDDPSAAGSQAKNNEAYGAMLAALERVGVAKSEIRSTGYDLRYVPPPEPTAPPAGIHTMPVARRPLGERYGYIVSRSAIIAGLDPAKVGVIVDASAHAGATSINGVTFGVRDQRGAYNQALAAAFADADAQARALASAGRFTIVRLQRVEAGQASFPGPMAFARVATADATQIEPSNVEVRANITVTYTIAPGP